MCPHSSHIGQNPTGYWEYLAIDNVNLPSDQHVVIPNWNPFKSIHWLASRSMSLGNRGSSFLFYDTYCRNY